MKRIVFVFVLMFLSVGVHAQFYGGFYHADPDAWFDTEPYFACRNAFVYNGWGQNLQNVVAIINDEEVYSFPYVWEYGSYIILGKDSGVDFSSEDKVALYCGNQYLGSWTYYPQVAKQNRPLNGKGGGKQLGKLLKGVWKYVKRIR